MISMSEPVSKALMRTEYPLFQCVSRKMSSTITADEAWRIIIEESRNAILLTDAEKRCIEQMLSRLGSSERELQDEMLSECSRRLEEMLSEAREHTRQISKLYTSLGFLLGLCAVIMIL